MAVTVGKQGSKSKLGGFSEEINKTVKKEPEEKEKGKAGRPSNGDVKKISLAIPIDLYEGVETGASLFFKGNKTQYINALIRKDLEENLEKYKEFQAMAQSR